MEFEEELIIEKRKKGKKKEKMKKNENRRPYNLCKGHPALQSEVVMAGPGAPQTIIDSLSLSLCCLAFFTGDT